MLMARPWHPEMQKEWQKDHRTGTEVATACVCFLLLTCSLFSVLENSRSFQAHQKQGRIRALTQGLPTSQCYLWVEEEKWSREPATVR